MNEAQARQQMVQAGRFLHRLGLAPGTSGNISVRLSDRILVTPTNNRLGSLDPAHISLLEIDGTLLTGRPPSKEAPLHLGIYRTRPATRAIVHLHALHSVAVSCLSGLDPGHALPPLTAYFLMRIGPLPLLPFFPPGSRELAAAVATAAAEHHAMLLANHGSVVAGPSLDTAIADAEELEQTARLYLTLRGHPIELVPEQYIAGLMAQ